MKTDKKKVAGSAKADSKKGKLTEDRKDIPHGQGAHVNEKEANAQEDYPGTKKTKS